MVSNDARLTSLEKAVIVLEDRRFFQHQGYDIRSIGREVVRGAMRRRVGGASTIDIQLFRTMSNRYERTARRKIREWVGARALQYKLSKLQTLRSYLEIAYFGTGLKGADAASQDMFAKFAADLDEEEACVVASMLVYPKPRIRSVNWDAKVQRRANYGRLLLRTRQQRFS